MDRTIFRTNVRRGMLLGFGVSAAVYGSIAWYIYLLRLLAP